MTLQIPGMVGGAAPAPGPTPAPSGGGGFNVPGMVSPATPEQTKLNATAVKGEAAYNDAVKANSPATIAKETLMGGGQEVAKAEMHPIKTALSMYDVVQTIGKDVWDSAKAAAANPGSAVLGGIEGNILQPAINFDHIAGAVIPGLENSAKSGESVDKTIQYAIGPSTDEKTAANVGNILGWMIPYGYAEKGISAIPAMSYFGKYAPAVADAVSWFSTDLIKYDPKSDGDFKSFVQDTAVSDLVAWGIFKAGGKLFKLNRGATQVETPLVDDLIDTMKAGSPVAKDDIKNAVAQANTNLAQTTDKPIKEIVGKSVADEVTKPPMTEPIAPVAAPDFTDKADATLPNPVGSLDSSAVAALKDKGFSDEQIQKASAAIDSGKGGVKEGEPVTDLPKNFKVRTVNGTLSKEDLKALKKQGFTPKMIDSIVEATNREDPVKTVRKSAVNPEAGFINPDAILKKMNDARDAYRAYTARAKEAFNIRADFTGSRDKFKVGLYGVVDQLRKALPDRLDQEALYIYREFQNKMPELKQMANGTHKVYDDYIKWYKGEHPDVTDDQLVDVRKAAVDRVRLIMPAINRALEATPAIKKASKVMSDNLSALLQHGKDIGILDSTVNPNEYINHILITGEMPLKTNMARGSMARKPGFAKARTFPTILDAMVFDKKPATINALDSFTLYADSFSTAHATTETVNRLKENNAGIWATADTAPTGWVPFAPPNDKVFKNLFAILNKEGDPKVMQTTFYVPQKFHDAFLPITQPNAFKEFTETTSLGKGMKALSTGQQWVKFFDVSFSLFHPKTLTFQGIWSMGVINGLKSLKEGIETPEAREIIADAAEHGVNFSLGGRGIQAGEELVKSSVRGEDGSAFDFLQSNIPVVKMIADANHSLTKLTFEIVGDRNKVHDYALHTASWLAKHPTATADEIKNAKREIGSYVNATYGGLHWENLGYFKSSLWFSRLVTFAPDWLMSSFYQAKYAFKGGAAGPAARAYWGRVATLGLAMTQATSLRVSGRISPLVPLPAPTSAGNIGTDFKNTGTDIANLTSVYMGKDKDGKDVFQNWYFGGAPGNIIQLLVNSADNGFISGAFRTIGAKASPLIRAGVTQFTGKNYFGNDIAAPSLSAPSADLRRLGQAALDLGPVPFSASTPFELFFSPTHYSIPEYITSTLFGVRTKHAVPDGMVQVKSGRLKGQLRPAKPTTKTPQSIIDQALSNKLY